LRRNDGVAHESPDDLAFEAGVGISAKILAALILNDLDLD